MEPRLLAALVLRLRPLGESDIMADLFTRELGRISALAKGGKRSRKRFFGLLESGHYLETSLTPSRQGGLWLLEGARLRANHLGLRQDYRRLILAGPVLELLLRATGPHDPHPGAHDLALATLARLDQGQEMAEMASVLVVFLLRLLGELGYGLELANCLHCGKPVARMSAPRLSQAGGLVCEACPHSPRERQVPPGLVKSLAAALELGPAALDRLRLAASLLPVALGFLGDFWRQVCGHDLPALTLAAQLLEPGRR